MRYGEEDVRNGIDVYRKNYIFFEFFLKSSLKKKNLMID